MATARDKDFRGKLDILILRTLLAGLAHGRHIAKQIQRRTEDVLRVEQGSLCRRLTGWSTRVGWRRSGNTAKDGANPYIAMSCRIVVGIFGAMLLTAMAATDEARGWLVIEGGSNPLNPVVAQKFREL